MRIWNGFSAEINAEADEHGCTVGYQMRHPDIAPDGLKWTCRIHSMPDVINGFIYAEEIAKAHLERFLMERSKEMGLQKTT